MIIDIAKFELQRHFKSPAAYIYFSCYAVLAFMFTLLAGGAFESVRMSMDNSNILVNGAYSIVGTLGSIGVIGLVTVGAFMGQAVYQDFHHRIHSLMFVKPVTKWQFLVGRFVGTFMVLALIFLSIPLGAYVATVVGLIPAEALGENYFWYYAGPYFSFIIGNLLWAGAIFFTLATLFRQMMPVYIGSLLLVLFWVASSISIGAPGDSTASMLIDPFGLQAAEDAGQYWSISEKNNQLLALSWGVLMNRLLWLTVGALMLVWCYRRFDFVESLEGKKAAKKASKKPSQHNDGIKFQASAKTRYGRQLFDGWSQRQAFFSMLKLELLQTLKNRYFLVLLAAAIGFIVFAAANVGKTFGTVTYPTTYMITDILGGGFSFFILIVIVFYAGELVWREKDAGIKQVTDAMPVPAAFGYFSKFIALMSVVALMLLMVTIAGVLIQLSAGYTEFDWHVYFVELFLINFSRALLLGALAMFIQTLVGNKYAGHGVMVIVYMSTLFLPQLGIDSLLLRFGSAPEVMYSDMNGYGTYLAAHFWFKAYWLAFAVILAQVSVLMWPRGEETVWRNRLANARNNVTNQWKKGFAVSGLSFCALAVLLMVNTLVINPTLSTDEQVANSVKYEREYREVYQKMIQPSIVNADFAVDIYANKRSLKLAGTYTLKNLTQQPQSEVFVNLPQALDLDDLSLDRQYVQAIDDKASKVKVLTFNKPLMPGEQTQLNFAFSFAPKGIAAERQAARIFENGTFLDLEYFPVIGFDSQRLLQSARTRADFGLGAVPELPDASDKQAVMRSGFSGDTHWVSSNYELSTDLGQTAISPGELVKQYNEGDRAYFSYKAKRATLFFPAVVSARYTVKEAKWNDVAIKVFHHERHDYNIDTMISGVQQSLEVFTKAFGEYPFDHVRIIEFPRFSRFAQSYPGTIPYSEAIGFIARLDGGKDEIDYPFFVTAHEMAHQWWPHQTGASATKGANMLSETLAQYSALVVMEHQFGSDNMRQFLRYGLDSYLRGRGAERNKEVPLVEADDHNYVLYDKGGIVMYALRDYIGADKLHQILRDYLNEYKYAGPDKPYPTSAGLVARIKRNIPEHYQYLIADLFENITLMDMRTTQATIKPAQEGLYQVTLKGLVSKNRVSELGESQTIAMSDLIDVGLFDEDGEVIYLKKHRFDGGEFELSISVAKKPATAAVDPFHKLIDRVPDDNRAEVVAAVEDAELEVIAPSYK
jgi:ABC-2 type transport system permease protein